MEFIEEEHKKKKFNKALYFYILVLALILSLYIFFFLKDNLQGKVEWVKRTIADGFITLTVKFVNFCIAKSLSSRNIAYLETEDSKSVASWMFWITLTNSISSLMYS